MLFKYYFRYGSLLWLAFVATVFWFDFFFLSVGDPGLPRWIKLRAFGIFYELFFFDNENYYQCVFILVFIGDQAI